MKKLIKRLSCYLTVVLVLIISACFLGESFSRYFSKSETEKNIDVATWKVNLKEGENSLEKNFNVNLPLTTEANPNIGSNKFAPGSSAKASLTLDLTGTEVSIDYNLTVGSLKNQIGLSDITLSVVDNNNNEIKLGKDVYVPLENGQKFTSENGIIKFNFNLTWNANSDNSADTILALTQDALSLPVYVKIKQHGSNGNSEEENKKITANISYIESIETKNRVTQPLNYTFTEQDILSTNPERGFYSTSPFGLNEDGLVLPTGYVRAVTKSNTSNMLYLKVDLSAFSGNMNESGIDKPLTDTAITAFENILEEIKQNNNTVILRFVYDNNATGIIENKNKVEPAQETILNHIEKLSNTFKKYKNTINVIQVGFYGLWGECFYNTDATENPSYYKQTVTALLNATSGTEITIAVRTLGYYSWYREINIADIENDITTIAEDAYRVCIFNDAYGASADDLGTYTDRGKETNWLENQASHAFYGGEAIVDENAIYDEETKKYINAMGSYNNPNYFINEAFKIHATYLNWEWNQAIHEEWAKQIYAGDDILYSGKSALTYIENHLGYRFVLKESRTYEYAESQGTLPIDILINNVGFANLVKSKQADIVITNSAGEEIITYSDVDIDARDFLSQKVIKKSITVNLPELSSGEYQIYLRLSSGEKLNDNSYYSAIRLANEDVYNSSLQANYIGKFIVQ